MAGNVLVVDDSAVMRQMIGRTMRLAGLDIDKIYEASNGIEGFARLAEFDVAAVLLDINMPVMNGVQFLKRMHDDPRLRGVPVIIASTEGSETRISELLDHGARGYIRKPFRPEQLRDVLAPLVGVRTEAESAPAAASDDSF